MNTQLSNIGNKDIFDNHQSRNEPLTSLHDIEIYKSVLASTKLASNKKVILSALIAADKSKSDIKNARRW